MLSKLPYLLVLPGHSGVTTVVLRDLVHCIKHVFDGTCNVANDEEEL